jgi:hypothetical protein
MATETQAHSDPHQGLEEDHCHAELADSWGYGLRCVLPSGHRGLHRYERSDGYVIMWGYE